MYSIKFNSKNTYFKSPPTDKNVKQTKHYLAKLLNKYAFNSLQETLKV